MLFQNESMKLELSEQQTPDSTRRRSPTQPSQLSAILAPNSLLDGDLDNIIDNDEDVQVENLKYPIRDQAYFKVRGKNCKKIFLLKRLFSISHPVVT
jgi:hypothetical protein